MRIGLIDVDGNNFPNIPLMKLSAWHKNRGDSVEWYQPMFSGHMDRVYMSKVFSFSPDYEYNINADEIIKNGTGYAITLVDGREVYDKEKDKPLPYEIEHIYPDYSIYPNKTKDTAYGFLTRGCPRGCGFCHVASKEGRCSIKAADLSEFWRGQKNIVLLDPNLIACKDWRDLLQQLIDSKARVDFTQGLDIRMMTEEKAEMIRQIKIKLVHFAYDKIEDRDIVEPALAKFADITGWDRHKVVVYVLVNFNTTHEDDIHRINFIRNHGLQPYVMIYDKEHTNPGDRVRKLQRWVNSPRIFWTVENFDLYQRNYA